ncbi:unnamed protein product [Ectocarpus sp. 12 AP-2014]
MRRPYFNRVHQARLTKSILYKWYNRSVPCRTGARNIRPQGRSMLMNEKCKKTFPIRCSQTKACTVDGRQRHLTTDHAPFPTSAWGGPKLGAGGVSIAKLVTYVPSQYKIRSTPAGITKSSVKTVTDSKLTGPPQMLRKPSLRGFNNGHFVMCTIKTTWKSLHRASGTCSTALLTHQPCPSTYCPSSTQITKKHGWVLKNETATRKKAVRSITRLATGFRLLLTTSRAPCWRNTFRRRHSKARQHGRSPRLHPIKSTRTLGSIPLLSLPPLPPPWRPWLRLVFLVQ